MRVGTKEGGDGVRCWNRDAVVSYAAQVDARERAVSERNPDVQVLPGSLVCYGCEVMEYDYGIKCTATLTRTRYAIPGEVEPRSEDAKGSLAEVEGMLGRAPEGVQAGSDAPRERTPEPVAAAGAPATPPVRRLAPPPQAPAPEKRGGLRGIFGR